MTHHIGIKFQWTRHENGNITAHMSQRVFVEQLLVTHNMQHVTPVPTPYHRGLPIDSMYLIKNEHTYRHNYDQS